MSTVFTREGRQKAQEELIFLRGSESRRLLDALSEARERGGIAENSEYDIAKEEYERLLKKIVRLENNLSDCTIVDPTSVSTDAVSILTTVTVKNTKSRKEMKFTIVPENEIDLKNGKISLNSPIGKGLIGKKVNEKADIDTPAGKMQLKIIEITA